MKESIISIVAKIAVWNIFAGRFNYPQFSYMEVFAMRMALTWACYTLWQKGTDKGDA